jgi:dienelactone hydrolase
MQLNEFETKEYFSKHPPVYQGGWHNLARAALAVEMFVHKYSPIRFVPHIKCPILFVAATQDVLCPVDQVYKAVKLAEHGQLLSRECTHFELYRGQLFEGLITEQVEFLQKHTGLVETTAAAAAQAVAPAARAKPELQGIALQASAHGDVALNRDQAMRQG